MFASHSILFPASAGPLSASSSNGRFQEYSWSELQCPSESVEATDRRYPMTSVEYGYSSLASTNGNSTHWGTQSNLNLEEDGSLSEVSCLPKYLLSPTPEKRLQHSVGSDRINPSHFLNGFYHQQNQDSRNSSVPRLESFSSSSESSPNMPNSPLTDAGSNHKRFSQLAQQRPPPLRITTPSQMQSMAKSGYNDNKLHQQVYGPLSAPVATNTQSPFANAFLTPAYSTPPEAHDRSKWGSYSCIDRSAPFPMPVSSTEYEALYNIRSASPLSNTNTSLNSPFSPLAYEQYGSARSSGYPQARDRMQGQRQPPMSAGYQYQTYNTFSPNENGTSSFRDLSISSPTNINTQFRHTVQKVSSWNAQSGNQSVNQKNQYRKQYYSRSEHEKQTTPTPMPDEKVGVYPAATIPQTKFIIPEEIPTPRLLNTSGTARPKLSINTNVPKPACSVSASTPTIPASAPTPNNHRSLRYRRLIESMPTPSYLNCFACNSTFSVSKFSKSQVQKARFGMYLIQTGAFRTQKEADSTLKIICRECTPTQSGMILCVGCGLELSKKSFSKAQRRAGGGDVAKCVNCVKGSTVNERMFWSSEDESDEEDETISAVSEKFRATHIGNLKALDVRSNETLDLDDSDDDGPRVPVSELKKIGLIKF